MKIFFELCLLCSLTACSSSTSAKEEKPAEQPKNVYRNPVIDYSLPDPSVIKADDGYFYLYANTYLSPILLMSGAHKPPFSSNVGRV